MSEDDTKQIEQSKKSFFELADDELLISHNNEPHVHRLVFKSETIDSTISITSSVFAKIKVKIVNWKDENIVLNWYKENKSFSLGINKFGTIRIFVKSDLSVFPIEFLRSFRNDFNFTKIELDYFVKSLNLVEMEIAHKINDPKGNLKNARVEYDIEGLISKLIAFTDASNGTIELELKGDPATSGNLEYLLRDKLNAILYFAELTKIVCKLSKIQFELKDSIGYITNGINFLIDDLLNDKLNKTEQTEQEGDK